MAGTASSGGARRGVGLGTQAETSAPKLHNRLSANRQVRGRMESTVGDDSGFGAAEHVRQHARGSAEVGGDERRVVRGHRT